MIDLSEDRPFDHECPHCGERMNGLAGPAGSPAEGDVTLCVYCANISLFTEQLTLRKATPEEVGALLRNPDIMQAVDALQHLRGMDWTRQTNNPPGGEA